MIEHIGIVKCLEMKNASDRARWRRDEAFYYHDLGYDPLVFGRRLRALLSRLRLSGTVRRGGRQPVGCEAQPACPGEPQAALRP